MAPQAKTDKRRKNKTKQTPSPQKTEKTLQNKPKSKQTQKKHCMFDSKCCCAWFSFWNCRYGSLRLKLHYPLAQDFRYLIGPCHFQPPGSTVKVENFQMKHMKISGTLSQDTLNNYQVLDFQDLAKSWIAKTWFYIYTFWRWVSDIFGSKSRCIDTYFPCVVFGVSFNSAPSYAFLTAQRMFTLSCRPRPQSTTASNRQ